MTLTAKQFRTEALEMAKTINASQYAGDLSPFPEDVEDTPAGLALTLAIIAGGYGFTVVDGYLFAIVSGDMGYTNTGIKVE
jgi:hypothetical protein